jgi:hypothetical protein
LTPASGDWLFGFHEQVYSLAASFLTKSWTAKSFSKGLWRRLYERRDLFPVWRSCARPPNRLIVVLHFMILLSLILPMIEKKSRNPGIRFPFGSHRQPLQLQWLY